MNFWSTPTPSDPLADASELQRMLDEGATHAELARRLGCSRSAISNAVRLLCLPLSVQEMLRRGELTASHGRILVAASDPEKRAQEWIKQRVSVREAETIVNQPAGLLQRRAIRAAEKVEAVRQTPRSAVVYFIQSGATGAIKIGMSARLRARLLALQIASGETMRILGARAGGHSLERQYHRKFASHRLRGLGEWFNPAREILEEAAKWPPPR